MTKPAGSNQSVGWTPAADWKTNGVDKLQVEKGVGRVGQLGAMGHRVEQLPGNMGNTQLVVVRPDGARVAVSDPRGHGRPGAYSLTEEEEKKKKAASGR